MHLCFAVAIDYLKTELVVTNNHPIKSQAFGFFSDSCLLNFYYSLDFKGQLELAKGVVLS
jgi:hypothetical protein